VVEVLLNPFWLAYLCGLLLSWGGERSLLPHPAPPWRRRPASLFVHVSVWTIAFVAEFALFRRPYFAAANVLAIELVLIAVSNAKFRALGEPFVYPDFEYFTDAVRHPRLYLPFLGIVPVLLVSGAYAGALWGALVLETPMLMMGRHGVECAALFAGAVALLFIAGPRLGAATFNPEYDLYRLGLVGFLWCYRRHERDPSAEIPRVTPYAQLQPVVTQLDKLPDLVTVQSESFFDVRARYSIVKTEVLSSFDTLCRQAVRHGRLHVPARGANTVRSEFAYLSGLRAWQLGIHKFHPYRRIQTEGVATIATFLRSRGYRTVCVHPYHPTFYHRDRVLPLLGFDEFVDISNFSTADLVGAYVGDQALSRYVISRLHHTNDQPLYIHVITMENHGPLHWERVDHETAATLLCDPTAIGCHDLVAYLRHLLNAQQMFTDLATCLRNRTNDRPGGLCIFGDHIPIMPDVYSQLGSPKGDTDYLIWKTGHHAPALSQDMALEDLGLAFLSVTNIIK